MVQKKRKITSGMCTASRRTQTQTRPRMDNVPQDYFLSSLCDSLTRYWCPYFRSHSRDEIHFASRSLFLGFCCLAILSLSGIVLLFALYGRCFWQWITREINSGMIMIRERLLLDWTQHYSLPLSPSLPGLLLLLCKPVVVRLIL